MKNQLRWACIPQEYKDSNEWILAIINTNNRETKRIEGRIIRNLRPVEDYPGPIEGKVGEFKYLIMRFQSPIIPKNIEWDKIFEKSSGRKEDRDLYERFKTGMDGLEAYVQTGIEEDRF